QCPARVVEPIPPWRELRLAPPDDARDASYLAASARISSFCSRVLGILVPVLFFSNAAALRESTGCPARLMTPAVRRQPTEPASSRPSTALVRPQAPTCRASGEALLQILQMVLGSFALLGHIASVPAPDRDA